MARKKLHRDHAPACEQCKQQRIMMVAMQPGRDGAEWWLCPRCYEDGLRNMAGELIQPASPSPADPKLARGSQAKISRERTPERSAAKEDVGSFEPDPSGEGSRLRFTGGTGTYIPDEDGYW